MSDAPNPPPQVSTSTSPNPPPRAARLRRPIVPPSPAARPLTYVEPAHEVPEEPEPDVGTEDTDWRATSQFPSNPDVEIPGDLAAPSDSDTAWELPPAPPGMVLHDYGTPVDHDMVEDDQTADIAAFPPPTWAPPLNMDAPSEEEPLVPPAAPSEEEPLVPPAAPSGGQGNDSAFWFEMVRDLKRQLLHLEVVLLPFAFCANPDDQGHPCRVCDGCALLRQIGMEPPLPAGQPDLEPPGISTIGPADPSLISTMEGFDVT